MFWNTIIYHSRNLMKWKSENSTEVIYLDISVLCLCPIYPKVYGNFWIE
ncbi:hypothetical protein LMG29660_04012 [Burkholderia puraquae]|uniref:Uncharacterized protein n=1 Tax=Burkholderia puraquae TaxID=1904757 RepID=A0A6J5E506_9BURK|nr:hypothetical protein LMG29660_04012 [Burkholderia puraquae]